MNTFNHSPHNLIISLTKDVMRISYIIHLIHLEPPYEINIGPSTSSPVAPSITSQIQRAS